MREDETRNKLIESYKAAGEDYLAGKLSRLFIPIENEKDRILHNYILAEVLILIDEDRKGVSGSLSRLILREYNRKPSKRFLSLVANRIMLFANIKRKG